MAQYGWKALCRWGQGKAPPLAARIDAVKVPLAVLVEKLGRITACEIPVFRDEFFRNDKRIAATKPVNPISLSAALSLRMAHVCVEVCRHDYH